MTLRGLLTPSSKQADITYLIFLDALWVPDTFMENSKEEFKHEVTVPNRAFRVSPNGDIYYSQRYTQE